MLYLSREQVYALVDRLGARDASRAVAAHFNRIRQSLDSSDVTPLYDDDYYRRIEGHSPYKLVGGEFKINMYQAPAYEYVVARLHRRPTNILDLGCGSGDFALALAAEGVQRVVGVDMSANSIETAKRRGSRFAGRVEFIVGAAAEYVSEERFDFIVLNDVTEHLSDRELAPLLPELARALEPDGEVVVHTPNGASCAHAVSRSWRRRVAGAYLRLRGRDTEVIRDPEQLYYDQVHINVKSFAELRRLLAEHGLHANVIYDEPTRWGFGEALSSNMLVVARTRRD